MVVVVTVVVVVVEVVVMVVVTVVVVGTPCPEASHNQSVVTVVAHYQSDNRVLGLGE